MKKDTNLGKHIIERIYFFDFRDCNLRFTILLWSCFALCWFFSDVYVRVSIPLNEYRTFCDKLGRLQAKCVYVLSPLCIFTTLEKQTKSHVTALSYTLRVFPEVMTIWSNLLGRLLLFLLCPKGSHFLLGSALLET